MFDSVLGRGQGPRPRIVLGIVLSAVLHAGVLVLLVWLAPGPATEKRVEEDVVVTFMPPAAPPLAGVPSLSLPPARTKPSARRPGKRRPDVVIPPRARHREAPPEVGPEPATGEEEEAHAEEGAGGLEGGVPGDVIGGVVGGVVGGEPGGVPGGQVGGMGVEVVPFGPGMTRPKKLSGPQPQYTREALEARVQGLMIVKCVITTRGSVERCRVLRSLPHMEQAVLEALYAQHYQPVTFQGRPVPVDYIFNIRLVLPRR